MAFDRSYNNFSLEGATRLNVINLSGPNTSRESILTEKLASQKTRRSVNSISWSRAAILTQIAILISKKNRSSMTQSIFEEVNNN